MELVGCAASVSQLVVYLHSSAVSLQRLYNRLVHEDSTYRDEATNVRLLLDILQRLSGHHVDDNSPVFPVLISISGIACQVLSLLQPKRVFGISWASIISQNKIVSAFEALNKKRDLLHFHISQKHQDSLVDLRKAIESSLEVSNTTISAKESAKKVMSPASTNTSTMNMGHTDIRFRAKGVTIAGHHWMANRNEPIKADVDIENFTVEASGSSSMFNMEGSSSRHPDYTAPSPGSTSARTETVPHVPETSQELQLVEGRAGRLQAMFNSIRSRSSYTGARSSAGNRAITEGNDISEDNQHVQTGREHLERR